MSEEAKRIRWYFSDLIEQCRVVEIVEFYQQNATKIEPYALAGLTWVQYAVRYASLETVKALVGLGFDVHALGEFGDTNALTKASHRGDPEIAKYVLSHGVEPFMDKSVGNPLFACMPGKISDTHPTHGNKDVPPENYLTIAKMLIDHGIDTTVRYDTRHGDQVDAMMFALIWQREDIAKLIAEHQADGDHDKAARLLQEAQVSVDALSLEGGSDEDE